jgi:anti-sigma B factor antagonist
MEIDVATETRDGLVIFTVNEEVVDHNNAASLKEKVFLEIADGENRIILNLNNISDLDSSGLGALLFGKRQAENAGGDMVLAGVSSSVRTMIRIAQLTHVFKIFPDVEKAIEFLRT